MKKKVVITGASGFLGGRTAKFFGSEYSDWNIVATSRKSDRASELALHNCDFLAGDLCSLDFCEELTNQTEIVIHCAALSSPFGAYELFYQSNFVATKNLLNASLKNGVKKFIHISTPSVYFNHKDRFNVSESDDLPLKMVNNYAKTKLMAESLILQHNNKEIQTIALRPRAIIGAEDTVIFPRMLEAYHKGKLKIVGDGNNVCDFTCARNVIEAIICSLDAPLEAYGQAYNITDGSAEKFWEVLNYALSSLDLNPITKKVPKEIAYLGASLSEAKALIFNDKKEPALTKYGVGILANNFTLDISSAQTMLYYKPIMTTKEGINEYLAWHKTQK